MEVLQFVRQGPSMKEIASWKSSGRLLSMTKTFIGDRLGIRTTAERAQCAVRSYIFVGS
jgi:hypothetical protein